MKDVLLVTLDNWQGLYIDGKCVLQEHHLQIEDVLEAVGVTARKQWIEVDDLEAGWLPDDESELPRMRIG